MILAVVLSLLALVFIYFMFLRRRFRAVERLKPIYAKLDAFYAMVAEKSRTILIARSMATLGYVIVMYDFAGPIVLATMGTSLDIGALVPGASWVGPAFVILGHLLTYIRKDPAGSAALVPGDKVP